MGPPIFSVCSADLAVAALLGSGPDCRLFPLGEAPEIPGKPYAVWSITSGSPKNYLSGRPGVDTFTLQVDVFADTDGAATAVTTALCEAIEPHASVVRWGVADPDPKTREPHQSFGVDWIVRR
ncbi:tail completion protein gp17 [Pseudomonas wadenswilerensis]